MPVRPSDEDLLDGLHLADGLLSLIGYRHASGLSPDLVRGILDGSATCRRLARAIEQARPAGEPPTPDSSEESI